MPRPPLSLAGIPTLTSLYADGTLTPTFDGPPTFRTIPDCRRTAAHNDRLSVLKHDITRLGLTGIVNAANNSLLGGGGVDGAIHRAAGPRLVDECETLDGCETGSAKITAGYDLPAEFVIHAVGPVYGAERRKEEGREERLLAGCYERSLELIRDVALGRITGGRDEPAVFRGAQVQEAREGRKVSIGFSGLSTGVYGYPKEEAAQVAIATVLRWLDEDDEGVDLIERVVFVCFEQADYDAYTRYLPQFCPPADLTAEDEAAGETDVDTDHEELQLPDVPTTEPKVADEPDAKKVKLSSGDDDGKL